MQVKMISLVTEVNSEKIVNSNLACTHFSSAREYGKDSSESERQTDTSATAISLFLLEDGRE